MKKKYKLFFVKYKRLFNDKLNNFKYTTKVKKNNTLKSFFYTGLSSLVIIFFAWSSICAYDEIVVEF